MTGHDRKNLVVLFLFVFFAAFIHSFCITHAEEKSQAVKIPPPLEHIPEPYTNKPQQLPLANIQILTSSGDTYDFSVELAKTAEEKRVGMMYRKSVPEKSGMIFLFDDEVHRSFWMKDTHVSLDILFIRGDGVIMHIHEKAQPFSLAPIPSVHPATAVLEIGGGQSRALGLSVGDRILYDYFKR